MILRTLSNTFTRRSTLPICVLMSLVLTGCAAQLDRVMNTDSTDEMLEELQAEAKNNERLAREHDRELEQSLAVEKTSEAIDEERFDLVANELPIKNFLRSLVRGTPVNMVVHPEVEGRVSLELKQVTLTEVMDLVRDLYGYDYSFENNTYQVYPNALRTEIFQVDYLNVSRNGHSEIQVSAGTVSGQSGGSNRGGDIGGGGFLQSSSGGSSEVIGTVVNTDGEADFWHELETTLNLLVQPGDGSQTIVTPQVGLVVVRARPDVLQAVREYLADVEGTLHRQVILEAKIVEVTLSDGFESGIDWNSFGDESGGSFRPVDGVGGSERSVAGEFLSSGGEIFNPLGSSFILSAAFGDFEGALQLLSTQGTVQVLSSPRIATVNNQKAVIKVGSDEFFVTDISTDTVTAGSAINTNNSPELTPFFSGIALDVTPQISREGDVVLHVHPTVSEVTEQLRTISGDIVPLAASTIRESDSVVRAADGEIIVIGGLMQNSSEDNVAQVPLFGRLPVLGHLFRGQTRDGVKSELVILLKPTVVNAKTQAAAVQRSIDNAQRLRAQLR